MSDRRRILDMLSSKQITADEADTLLRALDSAAPAPPEPPAPPRAPGMPRVLRIHIDAHDDSGENTRIRVNVPLGLAKFASGFLPREAKAELEERGVDLQALVDGLHDDLPEGRLVDIEAHEDDGGKNVSVVIEVA